MQITESFRRLAAGALALTGVLHLALAPEYFAEQAYVGALFVAGGLVSLGLGAVLWARDELRAWVMAGLVAAGMAVGFVLSRTVGLPGFHPSEWEASGLISLLLEGTVVAAALQALRPALTQAA